MIHRLILYVLLIAVVANSSFIAGYAAKKKENAEVDAKCINSLCEGKCKVKFVRHQGACEK